MGNNSSPLNFFEWHFTQEVAELLVTERNVFASQFFAEIADKVDGSYSGQWADVNITEIKTFIALIFWWG